MHDRHRGWLLALAEGVYARTSERSVERGLASWRNAFVAWDQGDFAVSRVGAEEASALAGELESGLVR